MPGVTAPADLKALMESRRPHAVIDVRERGEFNKRQIFMTTSLPRRDLEYQMARLVPVKATPIVLCDDNDGRAALAAATLERMGYTDVSVLEGGPPAWIAAGYELAEGTNTPSKDFGEKVLVQKRVPEMTVQEFHDWLEQGRLHVLIDTRTPEEFQRGTLPGSRNIPNGEMPLRIKEVVPDAETPVVVHCGGRTRSIIGAQILREMGIPNPLVAVQNGTMGWLLAGYELETGRAPGPLPQPSKQGLAAAEAFADRQAQEYAIPYLSVAAFQSLLARRDQENVYLVDVRTAEEYEVGHIPGFAWFPGGQAIQRTDEVVAVRAGHVVLACDGRVRATLVARWYREMGLLNVYALNGGVAAWREAGQPLESGQPAAGPWGLAEAMRAARFVSPGKLNAALLSPRPPLVVDLETSRDFAAGHVRGAAWLPRGWLELRIAQHAPDKDAPIILASRDGLLAALASPGLRDMGYADVSVLQGGTRGWSAAGYDLTQGMEGVAGEPDDLVSAIPGDRARMEYYLTWEEALGRKYETHS